MSSRTSRRPAARRPLPAAAARGGARLVILLALLLGLVGLTVWVAGRYLVSEEVRLPALEGLTYEQAALRLRDLGLVPEAYPELDARAQPNEVLSQAPGAGQVVRPGRRIALGVNALAEVRVAPNLVGLREADAVARAAAVGTVVERVSYVNSEQPVGVVVQQEPPAGSALSALQTLLVAVSRGSGSAPFELPDLRGSSVDAATAELTLLGTRRIELVPAALSFDRPNTVTDQRPGAGTEVLPGTPVTLVYALEGTRVAEVPDVVGLPMWRAQLLLRAAQLQVGQVRRIDDPSLPAGVVEASPSGYTVVGSPVTLTVNGAQDDGRDLPFDVGRDDPDPWAALGFDDSPPPPEEPVPDAAAVPAPGTSQLQDDGSRVIPFRFEPSTVGVASLMREPYRLQLVVADDEGERTVFDRELGAGEAVTLPVRVVGDEPLLQTFLNGSFFQAWRP